MLPFYGNTHTTTTVTALQTTLYRHEARDIIRSVHYGSVVYPDPVGSETFSRIRIRIWIQKKSFRLRAAPDPKWIWQLHNHTFKILPAFQLPSVLAFEIVLDSGKWSQSKKSLLKGEALRFSAKFFGPSPSCESPPCSLIGNSENNCQDARSPVAALFYNIKDWQRLDEQVQQYRSRWSQRSK